MTRCSWGADPQRFQLDYYETVMSSVMRRLFSRADWIWAEVAGLLGEMFSQTVTEWGVSPMRVPMALTSSQRSWSV